MKKMLLVASLVIGFASSAFAAKPAGKGKDELKSCDGAAQGGLCDYGPI